MRAATAGLIRKNAPAYSTVSRTRILDFHQRVGCQLTDRALLTPHRARQPYADDRRRVGRRHDARWSIRPTGVAWMKVSGCPTVFVNQAAKDIDAFDALDNGQRGHRRHRCGHRDVEADTAMGAGPIVVLDITGEDSLQGGVGPGRGVGVTTDPFPGAARPHPACASRRTGRSTCLARWLAARGGHRCWGPWGRDGATPVSVSSYGDAGCAGEHDTVVGEPPALVAEATSKFGHSDAVASLFVLGPYPAHDPTPGVAVDRAERCLGHSVSVVGRPSRQRLVETGQQFVETHVAG